MVYDKIFENIDEVVSYIQSLGWTLSREYFINAPFQVLQYSDNDIVYYPEPLFTPIFRGQNKFWNPCVSSLYRLNHQHQYEYFIYHLRIEEFKILISKHPAINKQLSQGLVIDFISLAQHYELKTSYLDLTNNLCVAAFFAVTEKCDDKYYPIQDGEGVLYFIPPSFELFPGNEHLIRPVGWQYLPRPGNQRAFIYKMSPHGNFNEVVGVFAFKFKQVKSISTELYEAMNGGELLFQKDIFAEKARIIQTLTNFSIQAFEQALESTGLLSEKSALLQYLNTHGIYINKVSKVRFSEKELNSLLTLFNSGVLDSGRTAHSRLMYRPSS